MTKLLLLLPFLITPSLGAVWKADKQWDMQWEEKYKTWLESDAVNANMFVSKKSKYYGAWLDCADAVYAIRAIFSFENGLPFALKNPTGKRGKYQYFTNDINKFDRYPAGPKRLVAYLNYLGEMVGTESLTRNETYPIAISAVDTGKLYTYKIRARFGKTIRHAYTIKKLNPTGTTDLIYATQAIKKKRLPLNYRKEKPFVNKPHDVWGYKGWIWPRLMGTPYSQFPPEMKYSREQYNLVKQLGTQKFFRHVKNTVKTVDESDQAVLARAFRNVCTEAQARIGYVQQGVEHHIATGGRCMNYEDYDAYSTPARDKALKDAYETMWATYKQIYAAGTVGPESQVYRNINAVFSLPSMKQVQLFQAGVEDINALMTACPIEYRPGTVIDLRELFDRLRKKKLSSHPNDSLAVRWGEGGRRTRCKAHY